MKTYRVVFSDWNGYTCGCCSRTGHFDKIYQSENREEFLKILKKDIKKYYWKNKDNGDVIIGFDRMYAITNNGKTETVLDDSSLLKDLEQIQKKVDVEYQKYQKRKEKQKIKKAIQATEKKIQENALQKELEGLKSKLKQLS